MSYNKEKILDNIVIQLTRMKKIVMVCDGRHFPNGAFELMCTLNKSKPILLKGIFLSSIQYSNLWFYPIDNTGNLLTAIIEEDDKVIAKSISLFSERCKTNNIEYRAHGHTEDFIFSAIKKESRFADLLVMSSESFYENIHAAQPNAYTKTVLHESECPVLLVPEKATTPSTVILSYDDSEDSVFAIKQFASLFPQWCHLETVVVYANKDGKPLPDENYLKELVESYFSRVTFQPLQIEPGKYFPTWAEHYKSGLVVAGSYGRSPVSDFFKKSFVAGLIKDHELPVFIAHK